MLWVQITNGGLGRLRCVCKRVKSDYHAQCRLVLIGPNTILMRPARYVSTSSLRREFWVQKLPNETITLEETG